MKSRYNPGPRLSAIETSHGASIHRMLASLALLAMRPLPAYTMAAYPLDPDRGRVEVECISPDGNVAANQGGEDKYHADDYIPWSYPVLLIRGKVVWLKESQSMVVKGVNDRGDYVLFDPIKYRTLICRHGRTVAFDPGLPDRQYFYPVAISASGSVGGYTVLKASGAQVAKGYFQELDGPMEGGAALHGLEVEDSATPITVEGLPPLGSTHWNLGPDDAPDNIDVGYGTHEELGDGPRAVQEYALYRKNGKIVALKSLITKPVPDIWIEEGGAINSSQMIAATGFLRNTPALFLLKPIH